MKYMGSKNRLAKHLLPIILQNRKKEQYYVEPFVGGANMLDKVKGVRIGGELNKYIAALLVSLSEGWLPPESITEEEFYLIKNNKNDYPLDLVGYVGTQLSFGSVWFCAYRRENGGSRNYAKETFNNVLKQAPFLKEVEFHCTSYESLPIPPQSIIYCDPPYKGTDKYRGFEQINHAHFWQWCREKALDGHDVFVSEFTAPDDFEEIWSMQVNTAIAERKTGKKVIEKLYIHKSQIENYYIGDIF